MKRIAMVAGIGLMAACSRNNNLLLGRVEAQVDGHRVVVTDCYRTSAPQPQKLPDEAGVAVWRYMPCRDADVWIRGQQLTVNGKEYGLLRANDGVLVDHGVVSIDHRGAANRLPPPLVKPACCRTSVTRFASFLNRRITRLRQSRFWRSASARIQQCSAWCTQSFSALFLTTTRDESPSS